jgi:hypothetical protein
MNIILYGILGLIAGLLDLVAFAALVCGVLTFFTLERLEPYRWHLIGFGLVGAIIMLPIADYFIGKAVSAIISFD